MTSDPLAWRLMEPVSADGDAVEVALGLEAARLRFGPVDFDFEKAYDPSRGVVLTLRRDGAAHAVEPFDLLDHNEQVVPKVLEDVPVVERESLEARYLRLLGKILFDDVANLVRREMEFQ